MGLAAPDLTLKQQRLAEAVVSGQAETLTQAGKMAGYCHLPAASNAIRSGNVQREIQRLRAQKLNTARSIRLRSQSKAASLLDNIQDSETAMRVSVMAA